MFTGIVEEVGRITAVEEMGGGRAFRVEAAAVLQGLRLGDSVAIDGACHTATAIFDDGFSVQSVATTLGRTTLGEFDVGRAVNLERALAVGDRLGGHMVQGHVDAVGEVTRVEPREELVLIDIGIPPEIAAVTVLHGSITVDGISLTVNDLPAPGVCQVSIIPYTRDHTTIGRLARGSRVNLEGDTIGKYVRHMLGVPGDEQVAGADLRRRWGYQS